MPDKLVIRCFIYLYNCTLCLEKIIGTRIFMDKADFISDKSELILNPGLYHLAKGGIKSVLDQLIQRSLAFNS